MGEHTEVVSAYVHCLRWIWSTYGSPSVEQVAKGTNRTFLPMSAAQVEGYLWEAAVPETSLMLHVLLRGITGHDAIPSPNFRVVAKSRRPARSDAHHPDTRRARIRRA